MPDTPLKVAIVGLGWWATPIGNGARGSATPVDRPTLCSFFRLAVSVLPHPAAHDAPCPGVDRAAVRHRLSEPLGTDCAASWFEDGAP